MITKNSYRSEGYADYFNGPRRRSEAQCPYPKVTGKELMWWYGWGDAQEEDIKTNTETYVEVGYE